MITRRHFRGQLFKASIEQRHWLGYEVPALPVGELVVVDEDEQLEEDWEGNGFQSGVHHDAGDLSPAEEPRPRGFFLSQLLHEQLDSPLLPAGANLGHGTVPGTIAQPALSIRPHSHSVLLRHVDFSAMYLSEFPTAQPMARLLVRRG